VNVEFLTETRAVQFPNEWYVANSEDHFWFQWRARVARVLIERIGLPTGDPLKVLDIGCGTGITSTQLARFTRWTFDGTDLNVEALAHCSIGAGRVLYYDILEKRRDFADAYDVVVLFDTLEHIEHTWPFLDAVFFHLKPGGVLLVNVPALMSLYGRYDSVAGHFRRYTRRTLAREFAPFDVTILDQVYWGFTMVPLLWLRQQMLRGKTSDEAVIQTGFVPPHPWMHALLKGVMAVETALVKHPPLGSSVMSAVRKDRTGAVT
jgi:SAM-dependent methyltransferase